MDMKILETIGHCLPFLTALLILCDSLCLWYRSERNLRRLEHRAANWRRFPPVRDPTFLILVPMYKEAQVVSRYIDEFIDAFGHRENCILVFITSILEVPVERRRGFLECYEKSVPTADQPSRNTSTPELVHSLLLAKSGRSPDLCVDHVVNLSSSRRKYAQLQAGIARWGVRLTRRDFVAVYDADSVPDGMIIEFIQRYRGKARVFQQPNLYPLTWECLSVLGRLAQARALLNLHYMLDRELSAYFSSEGQHGSKKGISHATHLTGHGEFIRLDCLCEAGGFRFPSCDTTLGYALSLRGEGIVAAPVIDVGTTPETLAGIFWQGVVWFNGVTLFPRERARLEARWTSHRILAYCRRTRDNLRWWLLPVSVLFIHLGSGVLVPMVAAVGCAASLGAYVVRDLMGLRLYVRMLRLRSRDTGESVPWHRWLAFSLGNAMVTRWVWAVCPVYVYGCRLLGLEPRLQKTERGG